MPTNFLGEEQRRRFSRFTEDPDEGQLAGSFLLDQTARRRAMTARGARNRIGWAIQLGTIRYQGTFLDNPEEVPAVVTAYVAEQLGLAGTGRTGQLHARPPQLGLLPDLSAGKEREAVIGADVLADWTTRLVAQFAVPTAQHLKLRQGQHNEDVLVDVETGSWAALHEGDDRWIVRQGGPELLWDAVEEHLGRWHFAGTPAVDEATVRVTTEARASTGEPHSRPRSSDSTTADERGRPLPARAARAAGTRQEPPEGNSPVGAPRAQLQDVNLLDGPVVPCHSVRPPLPHLYATTPLANPTLLSCSCSGGENDEPRQKGHRGGHLRTARRSLRVRGAVKQTLGSDVMFRSGGTAAEAPVSAIPVAAVPLPGMKGARTGSDSVSGCGVTRADGRGGWAGAGALSLMPCVQKN
ncbi:DUF4158 domain-containing protein [Streptomyces brasiliensis]|uniref:DUF4158 domain-containing protein n=1 Tax=Streptomyces brasiliensis TaxID=1954 RepID=UPI0016711220|nr:DUF4158 domain-containing protein [Streptomyces brasiliensis]